jgi:hypothetical protein
VLPFAALACFVFFVSPALVLVKKELTRRGAPRRRTVVQRGDLIITEHSEARFALPVRDSFCRAYPVITGNCIVLSIRKSSLPICENASLLPRCLVIAFFGTHTHKRHTYRFRSNLGSSCGSSSHANFQKLSFGHVRKTLDWVRVKMERPSNLRRKMRRIDLHAGNFIDCRACHCKRMCALERGSLPLQC